MRLVYACLQELDTLTEHCLNANALLKKMGQCVQREAEQWKVDMVALRKAVIWGGCIRTVDQQPES